MTSRPAIFATQIVALGNARPARCHYPATPMAPSSIAVHRDLVESRARSVLKQRRPFQCSIHRFVLARCFYDSNSLNPAVQIAAVGDVACDIKTRNFCNPNHHLRRRQTCETLLLCDTHGSTDPNLCIKQRKNREMSLPLRHLRDAATPATLLRPQRLQCCYSVAPATPTTPFANLVNLGSPPDLCEECNQEFHSSTSVHMFLC